MYFHTSSDRHRLIVDNLIKSVIVIVRSKPTVEDYRWSSCGRNRLSTTSTRRHRHRAVGISRTHNANRMLPIVQIRVQNSTHRKHTRDKRQFQNDGMSCITPVSSSYFVEVRACVRSAASSRRRRRRRAQSEGYEIWDRLLPCRTDPWVTSHGGNEFHVCIGAYLFVKCFQKNSVHFASFVLLLRHFFANFFSIIHDGHTFVGPGDRRERGLRFVRILGSEISLIPLAVVSFRLMRRFSNLWKKSFL
jgi:hypothetical protein